MIDHIDHLPKGWQPLAEEFLRKAQRDISGHRDHGVVRAAWLALGALRPEFRQRQEQLACLENVRRPVVDFVERLHRVRQPSRYRTT